MTLPNERYRAVNYAREFLRKMLHFSTMKKIPTEVRREAGRVLRHFPGEFEIQKIAECSKCGKILEKTD